jgi:hypothetical protein
MVDLQDIVADKETLFAIEFKGRYGNGDRTASIGTYRSRKFSVDEFL